MGLTDASARANRSPFPGLVAFTASEDDAAIFAGRDAESDLVAANLRAASLTILYGPSGVGKSSLLRAGVVRRIERQRRRTRGAPAVAPTVIVHDEWAGEAGVALARRVTAAVGNGAGEDDPELDVALERWGATGRGLLFIVLDQFEEYLRLHSSPDEDSFDRTFARTAGRDDLPVHYLLSLRDDALSELDRYQGRMPGLFSNYLRLAHMDERSARAAVLEPVARVNEWRTEAGLAPVAVEDGLVDEVFRELTDPRLLSGQRGAAVGPDAGRAPIELAFLQLVMRRLWDTDAVGEQPLLRRATLARFGGADAIVAGHLDAQMDSLTREQRDTAAAMFGFLVTPSGAKIRYTAADLAGYAQRPPEAVTDVLTALSRPDLRIIRRVPAPTGDPEDHGYEIFHDVLADAVRGWGLRSRAEQLERRTRRLACALAAALAALFALFVYAVQPTAAERLDLRAVDARFALRGAGTIDPRILLVGIDDRTVASRLRQPPPKPPISRADQARVLSAIDAGRPAAIVEDIEYEAAGDRAATAKLKDALLRARSPVVLATSRIDNFGQTSLFGNDTTLNTLNSHGSLATTGYSGFTPDRDGVLRHLRDQGRQAVGVLGLPTLAVRTAAAIDEVPKKFPDGGAWIDFAGGPGTYPHVSLVDVAAGRVPASRFKHKIVVVGETSLHTDDVHRTAAGGGTVMSGAELQANAIATATGGLPLRDAPAWSVVLIIVGLALVPAVATLRLRTAAALGVSALAGVVFLVAVQVAFGAGWVVPVVAPLLALVLSTIASQVTTRLGQRAPGSIGRRGRARGAPA